MKIKFIILAIFISQWTLSQTIKLEGYSSPYIEFCPEGVTELEFSA